jgi:hypothetical protein
MNKATNRSPFFLPVFGPWQVMLATSGSTALRKQVACCCDIPCQVFFGGVNPAKSIDRRCFAQQPPYNGTVYANK